MLARSGISWRWRARRRARTSCWPGSHPAARPPGRRAPDQSRAAPGRWCRMRRRIPAGCSATARPPSRVVAAGRRSHRRDTPRTAARRTAARPRTRALPRATHRRPPRQAGAPGDAPDPRRPDRERGRSEEHTSELQSRSDLVCRLLLEKKIKDRSSDAYSKVVDRLLASPRYGERWARHWLDVVHYADSHGHDQDRPRPNAWPYRDYVIRSFNEGKPYARFVQEQLAGDVLFPDDPNGIVATGFIATGPWDLSSLMAIMEDTVDKKIARYLDRDDMVMTTMSTFVSTTAHCARCHDHKFDPIPQREYYNLQAIFAGVDRADRPFDLDGQTNARRQALLHRKTALEVKDKQTIASLLTPETQGKVAAWEATLS